MIRLDRGRVAVIWLEQHGHRSGLLGKGADVGATQNEQGQSTEFNHLTKISDFFFFSS